MFKKFANWFDYVTFVETNCLELDLWKTDASQIVAEPSRLIRRKLAANIDRLIVRNPGFLIWFWNNNPDLDDIRKHCKPKTKKSKHITDMTHALFQYTWATEEKTKW